MTGVRASENGHFGKLLVHPGMRWGKTQGPAYVWRVFRSVQPRPFGWLAAGGYVKNNPGIPRGKPWLIGRFSLVYLIEGSGYLENAAGVDRTVSAGDLLLLFPDVAHAYGPDDRGQWHEVYIHFDGP